MIAKYGETITWSVIGETVPPDSDSPWRGENPPPVNYTPKVVFVSDNSSVRHLFQAMTNSDITSGADLGYMANVPFEPSLKDEVKRGDGSVRRIKSIDALNPNGEGVILYTLEFE